jgi:small ligand-binding sensory domain FIST
VVQFASALSEHPNATTAVGEMVGHVLDSVGHAPDIAALFVTAPHAYILDKIADTVNGLLQPRALIGCVAESVVGTGREVEHRPAMSLWAGNVGAVLPVELETVGDTGPIMGWPDEESFKPSALLLVGDPFSFPLALFFEWLGATHPGLPVIGGMASGARTPGETRLIIGGRVRTNGAVGILLGPRAHVSTVVSQGCRPIGFPWMVTKADGNVVHQLAGKPPLERLEALAQSQLTQADVALVNRGGLVVGRVIDEHRTTFGRGDFRIVGIMGADRRTGAIALAEAVETGSTLQFHLRDAEAADQDLRHLLTAAALGGAGAGAGAPGGVGGAGGDAAAPGGGAAAPGGGAFTANGALLFTCNGRGTRLFPHPHHDASMIAELLGEIPTGGFFAAGELGPVGGRNFLHSFTASIAIFEDDPEPPEPDLGESLGEVQCPPVVGQRAPQPPPAARPTDLGRLGS